MLYPVRTIDLQDWMAAPGLRAVMDLLNGEAAEPQALMVGGCVRNALLGLPVADVDIATMLTPEGVTARLERAGVRVVPTGIAHGTVTAVVDGKHYEITTLRRDVSTDGRRATVAFTDDWAEDARRRDFTMNTLLMDMEGRVFNPLGRGMADLEARRVVFVGEPAARIAEDYLRILRFFRFYAYYGLGDPDKAALKACAAAADKIGTLSRERITQEFTRILMADNAVDILCIMFENNVLKDISYKDYQQSVLRHLTELQRRYSRPGLAARLLVLAGFAPDQWEKFEEKMVFSNALRSEFLELAEAEGAVSKISSRAMIYKYKNEIAAQSALLNAARTGNEDGLDDRVQLALNWMAPDFPLTGQDVMAAGVPQGPDVGKILKTVEDWWIGQDFTPDRAALLRKMKEAAISR